MACKSKRPGLTLDSDELAWLHERVHQGEAGVKHRTSMDLIARVIEEGSACISTQVLIEFYAAATSRLSMAASEAAAIVEDLGAWAIHRPSHRDIVESARLLRRHKLQWWDALIVQSALESGCGTLWTEDLNHGQRFGGLTVRNPFR